MKGKASLAICRRGLSACHSLSRSELGKVNEGLVGHRYRMWRSAFSEQVPLFRLATRHVSSLPMPPPEGKKSTVVLGQLTYAAQEAKRILEVASSREQSRIQQTDENALSAADSLLLASSPSNELMESIPERNNSSATLHRAFLEVTSWCLDRIRLPDDASSSAAVEDENFVILDKVLLLACRAHALALPFHLPLYQRLMETFAAAHFHTKEKSTHHIILQVASWIESTLKIPMDDSLFLPSLLRLIKAKKLSTVVYMLIGMRSLHSLEHLELTTATQLFMALHEVVRMNGAASGDSTEQLLARASNIVVLLDSSIQHVFDASTLHEQIQTLSGVLSEQQIEGLLDHILQTLGDDSINNSKDSHFDPEDRWMLSILNKDVDDPRTRAIFSGLIKCSKADEKPTRTRFKPLGSFVDQGNHLLYQAFELTEDDWSDDTDSIITPSEMIYSRSKINEFPDITAQVVHMNDGRELLFTKEFEQILWARDYQDDIDVSEGPSFVSDDDSDDDDDDGDW